MQLLCADFVLTCNTTFEIIEDGAVAFEKSIVEIGRAHV